MPKYAWDIKDLVYEDDVKRMYYYANSLEKRVLISILWLTGGRPTEIKEASVNYAPDRLAITLPTKKLGKDGSFKMKDRTLQFERRGGLETNIYIETIIRYCAEGYARGAVYDTEEKLVSPPQFLKYTTRWQEKTIREISKAVLGKPLCPYHFRHSVMSWMAHNGATINELMHFKGAASVLSVDPYMNAKPMLVKLSSQHRTREPLAPRSLD